jgi:ribonuclease HI
LQVFTDGSVIDGIAGSGFVIPALKISKSYYIGKFYSIFIAELVAILMSLYSLCAQPISFFQIVFCVDSMSVIKALSSPLRDNFQREILSEIRILIHSLIMQGSLVSFCWVPSHLNISANN